MKSIFTVVKEKYPIGTYVSSPSGTYIWKVIKVNPLRGSAVYQKSSTKDYYENYYPPNTSINLEGTNLIIIDPSTIKFKS